MKQCLYLMLGYPGSGKSHFARGLASELGAVRFNSDVLRHYLYENPHEHHTRDDHHQIIRTMNAAAVSVIQSGYSVIYDMNNNFANDRLRCSAHIKKYEVPVIVVWVVTPLGVAIKRGGLRPLSQEHTRVTPEWIKRVAAEIEAPGLSELCIKIDGRHDFEQQYASFRAQLDIMKL